MEGILALTKVFPDGQKIVGAVLEYPFGISNDDLRTDMYEVEGRTITKVYASRVPERQEKGENGRFVILELSMEDEEINLMYKTDIDSFLNQRMHRRKPEIRVRQCKQIVAADGTVVESGQFMKSNGERDELADLFQEFCFKGLKYNLFIPEELEEGKEYPLVLFIHDAGACGKEARITLTQGIGAVAFASPEDQKKHPCFVLAPQFPGPTLVNDEFEVTEGLELCKELLDDVVSRYPVDRVRLYVTGQSMGCMSGCELNARYPDLFAASLLVAGQWDPKVMAPLTKKNMWIVVSQGDEKAFPGMNAMTKAMEEAGAKVGHYYWNGRASKEELDRSVALAISDECNIKHTIFEGETALPKGEEVIPFRFHPGTWELAYTIDGLRDWLFTQSL